MPVEIRQAISDINPDKIALLVDENTKSHCLPLLQIPYELLIEIKSGEHQKTLTSCEQIWEKLTQSNFSRKSLLINLGGGVIGDMGGFVAATYKRGMSFINLPTTLLSQVDASIGGKLGIDFQGLKNHLGVFKEPTKVIIHPPFLNTLSMRELKSGFAEVIKHGLIYDITYWLETKRLPLDDMDWTAIIQRSVEIKSTIVNQDPFEGGLRKILNFGHTLGHAIESYLLSSKHPLLHGEAIAMGMILEANLSMQLKRISESEFEEISEFICGTYVLPEAPSFEKLIPYLKQDKKNENSRVKFALLERIGKCTYDVEVSSELIIHSISDYNQMKRS